MTIKRIIVFWIGLTVALNVAVLFGYLKWFAVGPQIGSFVQDAPIDISIKLADMPTLGAEAAPVALIEFSDYECPYCRRHSIEVLVQVRDELVSAGILLYAFANNPLPIHANAEFLATSAICAGYQDRYWEMHDAIFETKATTHSDVISLARSLSK